MNWKLLTKEEELNQIKIRSSEKTQAIFKHSTRCSISSMVKGRLERDVVPEEVDFYYLDLIKYRNISDRIEKDFMVSHESPQILLIKNGECVYHESHNGISMDEIAQKVSQK